MNLPFCPIDRMEPFDPGGSKMANFQSPPISAKPAPYRRARRDNSNGFCFTSNGLRMRNLSHSVLWGQQAKLAKRGATWHPYCTNMTMWHVYEPMGGRHVASVQSERMTWQLYGQTGGSTDQSGCDTCHVRTMRWQSSQQYGPIRMRHVSVRGDCAN